MALQQDPAPFVEQLAGTLPGEARQLRVKARRRLIQIAVPAAANAELGLAPPRNGHHLLVEDLRNHWLPIRPWTIIRGRPRHGMANCMVNHVANGK